jgi:subtilisin
MGNGNVSRRRVLEGITTGAFCTLAASSAKAQGPPRYIVGTSNRDAVEAAQARAESVSRVIDFGPIGQAVVGVFPEQAREALRQRADVRYIERDGTLQIPPGPPGSGGGGGGETLPWGIDRVDAEVAHENGDTGSGDIAIIDTGIDDDHPDLQSNIGTGKAYVECRGRNCNEPWSDDNDHGTHVAGTADAIDNDEGVVGISTEVTLHAVKVLDNQGQGSFSDVADGIRWTADQGYGVANLSLGGEKSAVVEDAVEYADGNGVTLVGAAGNAGPCTDCVNYPAAEPEVIAVSATTDSDELANFSSTGPEIELAAPGEDVLSTVIGGYDTFSGTSMAAPHVAGAVAHGVSRSELKDNAEDIGLSSNESGAGLVDVAAALGLDSSDDLS